MSEVETAAAISRDKALALGSTLSVAGATTLSGTVTLADAVNVVVNTSTGSKIGTAATQKIGLWNAAPVAQYATEGTATGFTAGSGTAVNDDSTFTGDTGTKAYTVGDVVKALKLAGIMAAS